MIRFFGVFLMTKLLVIWLTLFFTASGWTQVFEVEDELWNGDWLSTQRDQLVHGEGYKGYPGPLPKMFVALGLDPDHPAIDFELNYNVNRESPYWFGQCNGWAAASVIHDEPETLVINGIKLFAPEVKAILTSIYKDNLRHYLSSRSEDGMTPRALESVLMNTIAQRRPVIFDVDISEAVWNFPVVSFARSESENGGWTFVSLVVGYVATIEMSDFTGPLAIDYHEYTYRYPTGSSTGYEWTGASINDHPKVAWSPSIPYSPMLWQLTADRYFNLGTYELLYELASQPGADGDLMEPNDQLAEATALNRQLVLGSLPGGDADVFTIQLAKGESFDPRFQVYDGSSVNLRLLSQAGNELAAFEATSDARFDYVSPSTQTVSLEMTRVPEGPVAFYQLVFPESQGYLDVGMADRVYAFNTHDSDSSAFGRTQVEVPAGQLVELSNEINDGHFRSSGDLYWVLEREFDQQKSKRYVRDHIPALDYKVPHLTFKNDWDTRLELRSRGSADSVVIRVYNGSGAVLQEANLPLDENRIYNGSLAEVLSSVARTQGAWFELVAEAGSLSGSVVYCRELLNDWVRVDLSSRPVYGEIPVPGVRTTQSGWSGVAMVNTSGVENEVQYRGYDNKGNLVDEGVFTLEPGEKWLNTVSGFSPSIPENGTFMFFTQYDVNAVVIHHAYQPRSTFGHRAMSYFSDSFTTAYMTVDENWQDSAILAANLNDTGQHILFEGYSAEGELQGRFHTILSNTVKAFETRYAPVSQIMENGVVTGDVSLIRYFKITAQEPVYCVELVGDPSLGTRTATHLIPWYENP